jgi:DNA-binding MarR family transcriptional regulator
MSEVSIIHNSPGSDEPLASPQNVSERDERPELSQPQLDAEPPLGAALFRVSRAMFFESKPVPELDALPMAQLRLLWAVRFSPDATMKDLSERLSVSQSTITQLADRLVRRNFVERNSDSQDRRVIRLRLSSAGQEIIQLADGERRLMMQTTWNLLTEKEQREVMRGLEILGRAAESARLAQGRPLPPWPDKVTHPQDNTLQEKLPSQTQPVVDLMTRRVRGR